jgi:colanic acid/amylovoran biosynthesis glycosyltransferase
MVHWLRPTGCFLYRGRLGIFNEALFKLGLLPPKLKPFLRTTNIFIIHSHFGKNGYASFCIVKFFRILHVTTLHGFDVTIRDPSAPTVGKLHRKFRADAGKPYKVVHCLLL